MHPMRPPPPPPFLSREDSQVQSKGSNLSGGQVQTADNCRSRLAHSSGGCPGAPPFQVQRRLFEFPDGTGTTPGSAAPSSPYTPSPPQRRKTDDGHWAEQRPADASRLPFTHQLSPASSSLGSPSPDVHQRRMSMPGDLMGQGGFSFPTMTPTSQTTGGGTAQHRSSRLAMTTSAPVSSLDGFPGAYHSPHGPSPRPGLSRATTPLHSGYPTPRSSMNGSAYGSPSEYGVDLSGADRSRHMKRMLSGVERGLDTPVWVARLRLLGRLLLAGLFANMLWQELREWRITRGYGWREWYDMSWVAEEMPPLPPLLSLLALVLLLVGWNSSLAAGYLAVRLLVQTLELWEDMLAVLMQQTSNLLPVKELAVVGTVIVFIGHTYYVPEWARGGRREKGKATGLLYTQQWRPGRTLVILLGQLLVAPLFISICALQYYDITNSAVGLDGWRQRLLHPFHWVPPGDSSANNWLPAQAVTYLLLLTNISNKRVPALLAALLAAEAVTCWRFWSTVWLSKHYVWYLRRHFMANIAIAGGLLLNLPEGKHDAKAVRKESTIGKKRT